MTTGDMQGIYLDHHATTPTDERVVTAMRPIFTQDFGNPASDANHRIGQQAQEHVKNAREQIRDALNAQRTKEIIFTSGATESDNLAIKSTMEYAKNTGLGTHVVTVATEHEAVLEPCEHISEDGFEVTVLPVDEHGLVDLDEIRDSIREETALVSIMAANNEVGTVAPIMEIGSITDEYDVLFHTDAVQAVGYREFDVQTQNIDLMSISGHKIYGPTGVGALCVDYDLDIPEMEPLLHGGGQERGLRSGTLNVPGIVGLGKAISLAEQNRDERSTRIEKLRNRLWTQLSEQLDDLYLNGHPERRLPNNLNVSFLGVDNRRLLGRLNNDGVYAASGSACSTTGADENSSTGKTHEVRESHVLEAMFEDTDRIRSAIRFGLGKDTSEHDIDQAAEIIVSNVNRLRQFN